MKKILCQEITKAFATYCRKLTCLLIYEKLYITNKRKIR